MSSYEINNNFEICIAGKNNIAVDILEYILNTRKFPKERVCVICNKTDNGKDSWQRSLRLSAKKNKVKEVQMADVYERENLFFLSLEYDRIIKPHLFRTKHLYNIHFSLLPKYKGMYTSAMPLLFGEKKSGVTFHEIDRGIDTGNIIFQESFQIGPKDTCREMYMNYIQIGTKLVRKVVDIILEGKDIPKSIPQSPYGSSYFSKKTVDYDNLKIDFYQTAQNVYNQIRAYNFREYQLPEVDGFKISSAEISSISSKEKPGTVIWDDDNQIVKATIDYDIILFKDKFMDVIEICREGDLDKLKRITNLRVYLNQAGEKGCFPLTAAVNGGYYDMSMFLLYAGSDISVIDWEGNNLLVYAKNAFCKTGDPRLFEMFDRIGLKKEDKNFSGKSLIDYCIEQNISRIGNSRIY